MPSIHGGGGFIPRPVQTQTQQVGKAQPAQPQDSGSKDVVRLQASPSQTSLSSQIAQRLTSENTRTQIHNLIQQNQVQVPEQKPQLNMMQRPAMSSALADMLANHHVPEQQNNQAQQAAGSLQASYQTKTSDSTEDSVRRNSLQSGKRLRKEEQEGEFSSLDDMSGGDSMSGDQSGEDQRSDSQKEKTLVTAQEKQKSQNKLPLKRPGQKPVSLKPNLQKLAETKPQRPGNFKQSDLSPPTPKPGVQRIQSMKPAAPKKKPDDEWTL